MKINTAADAPTVKKKAKFPWGTIFLTGMVSTVATVVAMRMIEAATKKRAGDDDLNAQRDALLNPGAVAALSQAVHPPAQPRTIIMTEETLLELTQRHPVN